MFDGLILPFVDLPALWAIPVQGALVSVALGVLGCFLVVRGLSLLGDALSHSVLPGVVVGFLVGGSLSSPWILVGATVVGLMASSLVQAVHGNSRVKEDAALGIVFTTLFAVGVVMINQFTRGTDLDPGCVLYGNIEHAIMERQALVTMAVIAGGVVLGVAAFYRQLLVVSFDPALAVSLGMRATWIHYGLMAALSLTVVASFESVGAILVVALLIMPGATARLWTERMPLMLVLSAVHGVLSAGLGYWLSHEAVLNTSASGAMCVAGFALFLASWLASPRHGVVTLTIARRRLARRHELENLVKTVGELRAQGASAGTDGSVEVVAVAREMGVLPGRLSRLLGRTATRDWITVTGGPSGVGTAKLSLTEAGQTQAKRLVRAHALWEKYLRQEFGLDDAHVHDAAEWIEHHLDEERAAEIAAALERRGAV